MSVEQLLSTAGVSARVEGENQPDKKFRRVSRAVKSLIQVCHVCRSLQSSFVTSESWFALLDNLVEATSYQNSKKQSRAFVTIVANELLTFDVSEYRRHRFSADFVTDSIREMLQQPPGTRTSEQISEIRQCLKGLSQSFCEYPIPVQKQICQCAFYDKYHHNRVIIRRGLPPDGIYFVLSGTLIEKHEGKKQPVEITTGDKFGEEDLVCGCARRHTVITRHQVELLTIHRLDYGIIFNMSADSNNPRNLEICRQDVVFQHFPMHLLKESPGTWSTLKYKFGRLIVKDSNNVEWIYVIRSGEARVLQNLEPETIDVRARRQKIQEASEEKSPYHRKLRLLNFIQEKEAKKSEYRPSTYKEVRLLNNGTSTPRSFEDDERLSHSDIFRDIDNDVPVASRRNSTENKGFGQYMTTALYRNAPEQRKGNRKSSITRTLAAQNVVLPPFVQVETLHPGQTFGMRAVLDPDIRGPSVSLVSGDCEVLAINKKFFQKHCDEAMYSLIMLKTKPFPSQEELVDRLDANMQWEEFKKQTLQDFLRNRNRVRNAWTAK
ncbi:hypothetical protein ScPMuIL_010480 [Solemya velum]